MIYGFFWCWLSFLLCGCGAFADLDETNKNQKPTMNIEPPSIRQGQIEQVEFTFLKHPPWYNNPNANSCFLVDFNSGEDLGYINPGYDCKLTVTAVLNASRDATIGERVISVEVVFQPPDSGQQHHFGWGKIYVADKVYTEGSLPGVHDQ